MKQFLYSILIFLWACNAEDFEQEPLYESKQVTVQFQIDIPEPQVPDSRVINENLVFNLQLLVFDENRRFISRHAATLNGSVYTSTLPQSSNKRIIHFIANYDWSNVNDESFINKDEREIIPSLQSSTLLFWQRMVLNSGINANTFNSQQILLIRNVAKISLVNKSSSGLTNAKFAVFNMPSSGSAAPFNTTNREFEQTITEPAGATFNDASTFDVADVYSFERKNSTVTTTPMYVIVQGSYAGSTYYYKIDIIDDAKNMYDITRNTWYKIIIENVAMTGYATLAEAQSSPASNNISTSVLLQSYPTISDGQNVLSVDKTVVAFTGNGQTLHANATYKTVTGTSLNSMVAITLIQDPNFPVINGNVTYDAATGNLTASINNVPSNGVSYFATIKIEAGYLSRTIRLMLHAPFTFSSISLTPSQVSNVAESSATLKFTVPAEAEYLLPFNCYITSAYLTPSFGNIEIIHEGGLYKYKWKVTEVGEQVVQFKTNTTNAAETLFIEAGLFQQGQISYTNTANLLRFSNVVLTPNPVNFGTGNSVTLKFTVPTAGTYRIYTTNLTPVNGSVSGGYYNYIATTVGEQIVKFTTNKQNSAETIRLTGTNYIDYSVALKNQLVTISGTLTYRNSNTTLSNGTVTISVGTKVVAIVITNETGAYQTAIEVGMGETLTFTYTRSSTTYTATQVVTASQMTVNKRLL